MTLAHCLFKFQFLNPIPLFHVWFKNSAILAHKFGLHYRLSPTLQTNKFKRDRNQPPNIGKQISWYEGKDPPWWKLKKLHVAVQWYEVISACMNFLLRGVFFQIYGALLMLKMFAIGWKLDRDCCKLLLDTKVSISFFSCYRYSC